MGFEIITFELVAGISLSSEGKTCDRQSKCEKTVLRLQMSLEQMFLNSIKIKALPFWFQQGLGFDNTLTTEECSERRPFEGSINHIFQSQ